MLLPNWTYAPSWRTTAVTRAWSTYVPFVLPRSVTTNRPSGPSPTSAWVRETDGVVSTIAQSECRPIRTGSGPTRYRRPTVGPGGWMWTRYASGTAGGAANGSGVTS